MPHTPYLPDLALSDCFLFPRIKKKALKGKCFADVEEVKQKTEALNPSKLTCSKTVLNSGKKVSIAVLHQMESTLKVTEV